MPTPIRSIHAQKANGVSIISTQKTPISRPKTGMTNRDACRVPHRTYNRTISAQKADRRPQPEPIPSYIKPKQKKEMQKKQQQQNQNLTMQSYLDDPDCIQLREQIMDNSDLTDIENERLEKLLLHLREYSADCATKRMYDDASIANAMTEYINKELALRGNQIVIDRSLEESYENQREKTMQKHQEEQQELIEKFDKKRERLEQSLRMRWITLKLSGKKRCQKGIEKHQQNCSISLIKKTDSRNLVNLMKQKLLKSKLISKNRKKSNKHRSK